MIRPFSSQSGQEGRRSGLRKVHCQLVGMLHWSPRNRHMTTSGQIVRIPALDFDLPCTSAPGSRRRRVSLADFRQ